MVWTTVGFTTTLPAHSPILEVSDFLKQSPRITSVSVAANSLSVATIGTSGLISLKLSTGSSQRANNFFSTTSTTHNHEGHRRERILKVKHFDECRLPPHFIGAERIYPQKCVRQQTHVHNDKSQCHCGHHFHVCTHARSSEGFKRGTRFIAVTIGVTVILVLVLQKTRRRAYHPSQPQKHTQSPLALFGQHTTVFV